MPNSPDYNPTTPPLDNIFIVNGNVFLHGDTIPNRIWTITKIGDRFITIQTSDDRQLEPGDTIKIVTPLEIFKPNDVVYDQRSLEPDIMNQNLQTIRGGSDNNSGYNNNYPNQSGSGGLTFAPHITVVGGSDNKVTVPPPSLSPSSQQSTDLPFPEQLDNNEIIGGNNGKIDFNKLTIIKKG